MTEPFYAPHQLAELQEGYYAVNRTYEQLLGEFLSLRLTNEAAYEYARHGFVRRLATLKRCTGTSTGRLMLTVLDGGLWLPFLVAPAKAGAQGYSRSARRPLFQPGASSGCPFSRA